jgi:nitrate reductase gamma subunit
VGFDGTLAAALAATAVLALWRRQLVILAATIAGSLLFCDAWFDATTAAGSDRWLSFLSIPVEVGLALVLLGTAAGLVNHLSAPGGKQGGSRHSAFRALPGVRAGGWVSTFDALRGRQG